LQEKSKSIDPFAYLQYVLDISKNDNIKDILADLSCPVLLIAGENDSVVDKRNSMRMSRIIKNSEYIAIPGAGHFSYVTHYKEFNRHVIDFMLCSERMVN
jgi:pimeloyl-ACP methyl ester carboxylesterase